LQFQKVIEKLSKIPRMQRMILYGGLYVFAILGFWLMLYIPSSQEHSQLVAKNKQLTQQKRQVESRAKNKEQFKAEVQQLVSDLTQALKELPKGREIPGLLKGIDALAKKKGLEVRKFSPLPEVKQDYVARIPVELELEGSFHELAMFFDHLAKMNRIVYVEDIEMASPEERGGKVILYVSGEAVTFRFLTEEELAEQEALRNKKGKKGRKKRMPKKGD